MLLSGTESIIRDCCVVFKHMKPNNEHLVHCSPFSETQSCGKLTIKIKHYIIACGECFCSKINDKVPLSFIVEVSPTCIGYCWLANTEWTACMPHNRFLNNNTFKNPEVSGHKWCLKKKSSLGQFTASHLSLYCCNYATIFSNQSLNFTTAIVLFHEIHGITIIKVSINNPHHNLMILYHHHWPRGQLDSESQDVTHLCSLWRSSKNTKITAF